MHFVDHFHLVNLQRKLTPFSITTVKKLRHTKHKVHIQDIITFDIFPATPGAQQ